MPHIEKKQNLYLVVADNGEKEITQDKGSRALNFLRTVTIYNHDLPDDPTTKAKEVYQAYINKYDNASGILAWIQRNLINKPINFLTTLLHLSPWTEVETIKQLYSHIIDKNDRKKVLNSLTEETFSKVLKRFQVDEGFVLEALKTSPKIIADIVKADSQNPLKKNSDFLLKALEANKDVAATISSSLSSEEFLKLVEGLSNQDDFMLKGGKDFILKVIPKNPGIIKKIVQSKDHPLKKDFDFLSQAVNTHADVAKHIADTLSSEAFLSFLGGLKNEPSQNFMILLIQKYPEVVRHIIHPKQLSDFVESRKDLSLDNKALLKTVDEVLWEVFHNESLVTKVAQCISSSVTTEELVELDLQDSTLMNMAEDYKEIISMHLIKPEMLSKVKNLKDKTFAEFLVEEIANFKKEGFVACLGDLSKDQEFLLKIIAHSPDAAVWIMETEGNAYYSLKTDFAFLKRAFKGEDVLAKHVSLLPKNTFIGLVKNGLEIEGFENILLQAIGQKGELILYIVEQDFPSLKSYDFLMKAIKQNSAVAGYLCCLSNEAFKKLINNLSTEDGKTLILKMMERALEEVSLNLLKFPPNSLLLADKEISSGIVKYFCDYSEKAFIAVLEDLQNHQGLLLEMIATKPAIATWIIKPEVKSPLKKDFPFLAKAFGDKSELKDYLSTFSPEDFFALIKQDVLQGIVNHSKKENFSNLNSDIDEEIASYFSSYPEENWADLIKNQKYQGILSNPKPFILNLLKAEPKLIASLIKPGRDSFLKSDADALRQLLKGSDETIQNHLLDKDNFRDIVKSLSKVLTGYNAIGGALLLKPDLVEELQPKEFDSVFDQLGSEMITEKIVSEELKKLPALLDRIFLYSEEALLHSFKALVKKYKEIGSKDIKNPWATGFSYFLELTNSLRKETRENLKKQVFPSSFEDFMKDEKIAMSSKPIRLFLLVFALKENVYTWSKSEVKVLVEYFDSFDPLISLFPYMDESLQLLLVNYLKEKLGFNPEDKLTDIETSVENITDKNQKRKARQMSNALYSFAGICTKEQRQKLNILLDEDKDEDKDKVA